MQIQWKNAFVQIQGEAAESQYPVGTIYGLGKNYADHVAEMGWSNPDPVIFVMSRSSLSLTTDKIELPEFSKEIHNEIELVVYLHKGGKNLQVADWRDYVLGVGLGLDLTARDLQAQAKEKGSPWSVSKGFDHACIVTQMLPVSAITDIDNLELCLRVNKEIRQKGSTGQMILNVKRTLEYISQFFTLYPGDLLYTGTPAGVGPLYRQDFLDLTLSEGDTILIHETFQIA